MVALLPIDDVYLDRHGCLNATAAASRGLPGWDGIPPLASSNSQWRLFYFTVLSVYSSTFGLGCFMFVLLLAHRIFVHLWKTEMTRVVATDISWKIFKNTAESLLCAGFTFDAAYVTLKTTSCCNPENSSILHPKNRIMNNKVLCTAVKNENNVVLLWSQYVVR